MLIINKSLRSIDGIKSGEQINVDENRAKVLLSMYRNDFIVIQDNSKELEQEIEVLKTRIIELGAENKQLLLVIADLKENVKADCVCDVSIEDLRAEYKLKFSKVVPRNMQNNKNWILKQIRG